MLHRVTDSEFLCSHRCFLTSTEKVLYSRRHGQLPTRKKESSYYLPAEAITRRYFCERMIVFSELFRKRSSSDFLAVHHGRRVTCTEQEVTSNKCWTCRALC